MKFEICSYLFFGLLTTGINISLYALTLFWGGHYLLATVLAWIGAVAFAFFTNQRWVFREKKKKSLWHQIQTFVGSRLLTGILEALGLVILIDGFGKREMISKGIMVTVVVFLNYVISKYFVFEKNDVTGM